MSTTEKIDRTGTATDEKERLAKRQAVRVQLAERFVKRQREQAIRQEIARIDEEVSAATDAHQATCTPLQQELEELEQRAILRIAERQPADESEDNRRREIIAEITAANETLEDHVQCSKRQKLPLERQASTLRFEAADEQALRNRLTRPDHARPDLLIAHFVSDQRVAFAQARAETARKKAKYVTEALQNIRRGASTGDLPAWGRKASGWAAEIEAAENELAEARAESRRIYDETVNE